MNTPNPKKNKMTSKRTPLPWEAVPQPIDVWILKTPTIFKDVGENMRVSVGGGKLIGTILHDADAAFVVRAVNSHEELLAACKWCLKYCNLGIQKADEVGALIAKAESQP